MPSSRGPLSGVAVALALSCSVAEAAVIVLADGGSQTLTLGSSYIFDGLFTGLSDTFHFTYDPPPGLTAFEASTNNLDGNAFGVSDMTLRWLGTDSPIDTGPLPVGAGQSMTLPLFNGLSHYDLILAGTPNDVPHYDLTITLASSRDEGGQAPLPGAVFLLGSVLVGAGLLARSRRRKPSLALA